MRGVYICYVHSTSKLWIWMFAYKRIFQSILAIKSSSYRAVLCVVKFLASNHCGNERYLRSVRSRVSQDAIKNSPGVYSTATGEATLHISLINNNCDRVAHCCTFFYIYPACLYPNKQTIPIVANVSFLLQICKFSELVAKTWTKRVEYNEGARVLCAFCVNLLAGWHNSPFSLCVFSGERLNHYFACEQSFKSHQSPVSFIKKRKKLI